MSRFDKVAVFNKIASTRMVPVFYHKDVEIVKKVVKSCYDGGVRVFEFTNRGDFAHEVFCEVVKYAAKECPDMLSELVLLLILRLLHSIFNLVQVLL